MNIVQNSNGGPSPPNPRAEVQSPLLNVVSSTKQGAEGAIERKPFVWNYPVLMIEPTKKPERGYWRSRFLLVVYDMGIFITPPEHVQDDEWLGSLKFPTLAECRESWDKDMSRLAYLFDVWTLAGRVAGRPALLSIEFFPEAAS